MNGSRVLIYSHDSFGLGHLRRCREIAHGLVGAFPDMSVLILSGSPIIGSFDFRTRTDFVRVPGVIKLRNGDYTSLKLKMDIDHILKLRGAIIERTAEVFEPDVFIVDKEPLGLRGEVARTLKRLKRRGTRLVLGLRDVMDEPAQLAPEWKRKRVLPALRDLYDDIWVYGLPEIHDPLEGIDLPADVRAKMTYTGYLRRAAPQGAVSERIQTLVEGEPYILVTTGGGGDGEELIDWVIQAYEQHGDRLPHRAVLVLGPFMSREARERFGARAHKLDRVDTITFDARIETLMAGAEGVVAMGGYNTFCEILSLDKRAIIVPRTEPRLEQFIRADRADKLGLVRMLLDPGPGRTAAAMADALVALAEQAPPSAAMPSSMLDGLDAVARLVGAELDRRDRRAGVEPGATGRIPETDQAWGDEAGPQDIKRRAAP
ncbi:glycosyltransferase [Tistrella bauzanensis]|uniref:Glycosyltransferase n=1 Tax=Tistrella arctica TaxID=3133430 RepID=A0ABU9YHU7_9PROT